MKHVDASASIRQRLVARQTHLDYMIAPPKMNVDNCFVCSGASLLQLDRNIGLNKVKRESNQRMQHFYFKYETLYCTGYRRAATVVGQKCSLVSPYSFILRQSVARLMPRRSAACPRWPAASRPARKIASRSAAAWRS